MSKRAFVKTVGRQDKGSRPLARVHTTRRGQAMVMVPQRMLASQTEKKNIDVESGSSAYFPAATATGTVTLLNGVAQGTSATTRLGRRITMKSLYIRYDVSMAATATGSSPLRVLVVYDKQSNGAAPAATDILFQDKLTSMNNLGNSRRFVTLFDDVVPCVGTAGPQACHRVLYKKLNLPVEFNTGNAGTVADIQTGSVYLLTYTEGTILTAAPNGRFLTRIRFTDN